MSARTRKGWRGPSEPGEFPTLGWLLGEWIEAYVVIPDGPQRGQPYRLTREMWQHLLFAYRLNPKAKVDRRFPRPVEGRVFRGSQLRRAQKWGKDPFMAAKAIAHALGPAQWDGWDADGEPVGRPIDTPWVQIAATSDEQTDNTYRPLYRMLTEGPLADTPGLDVGETRTKLPNGDGWIEPVTCSMRSRLGAPISHATFTEPHLMCQSDGGLGMVRAMKRGLAGMGGDWQEGTNPWDPTERSAAQQTAEDKAADVYIDHIRTDLPNLTPEEFADDQVVLERIRVKYGDSARSAGGWVDERIILAEVRKPSTGETEARRYFLDEIVVGEHDAVNATRWQSLARPGEFLEPGEPITLGFDGSRVSDCTALKAVRITDGRWFTIGVWDPTDYPDRKVPEFEVDAAVEAAMTAYEVWYLIGDPYLWQTNLDRWSGQYGKNPADKPIVIDFPTNVERRMDEAILLWQTAYRVGEGEFTHDGHPVATQHAFNAAIGLGKKKPPRDDGTADDPKAGGGRGTDHYQKIVKKKEGVHIDDFVAGILGTFGRGLAIEHGALSMAAPPNLW